MSGELRGYVRQDRGVTAIPHELAGYVEDGRLSWRSFGIATLIWSRRASSEFSIEAIRRDYRIAQDAWKHFVDELEALPVPWTGKEYKLEGGSVRWFEHPSRLVYAVAADDEQPRTTENRGSVKSLDNSGSEPRKTVVPEPRKTVVRGNTENRGSYPKRELRQPPPQLRRSGGCLSCEAEELESADTALEAADVPLEAATDKAERKAVFHGARERLPEVAAFLGEAGRKSEPPSLRYRGCCSPTAPVAELPQGAMKGGCFQLAAGSGV